MKIDLADRTCVYSRPMMVHPRRACGRRLAVCLAVLAVALTGFGPAAGGAPQGSPPISCNQTGASLTVVASGVDAVVVKRVGDGLRFRTSSFDTVDCGTVTTVDTVTINLGSPQAGTVGLDLSGGPFAPGKTPETAGTAEIEFDLTGLGQFPGIEVIGTSGADAFTVGNHFDLQSGIQEPLLNLNAAESLPDVDVSSEERVTSVALFGEAGNDLLSGGGVGIGLPGFHAFLGSMTIVDGPGADVVQGGPGSDVLFTSDDPDAGDVFSGGLGTDFMDWQHRTEEINVSLNNKPDDGHSCPRHDPL